MKNGTKNLQEFKKNTPLKVNEQHNVAFFKNPQLSDLDVRTSTQIGAREVD